MRIAIIGLGLALIFAEKMPRPRQEEIRVGCNRALEKNDLTVNGAMEKHPDLKHVNTCFIAYLILNPENHYSNINLSIPKFQKGFTLEK